MVFITMARIRPPAPLQKFLLYTRASFVATHKSSFKKQSLYYTTTRTSGPLLENVHALSWGFSDFSRRNDERHSFREASMFGGMRCLSIGPQNGICSSTSEGSAASTTTAKQHVFEPDKAENNQSLTDANIDSTMFQTHWDYMLETLKVYKFMHGDTLVPVTYPPNPPLGNWIDNQRQNYRMRQESEMRAKLQIVDNGEISTQQGNGVHQLSEEGGSVTENASPNEPSHLFISDERIEALNSIGFVWNLYDHAWNMKYEELKQYVDEHGNTLVPIHQGSLGMWVAKQRRSFKVKMQRKEKKSSSKTSNKAKADNGISDNETSLSDERIQKLNDLGFVWDVHVAQWSERLEELRKYRMDHGDALVPKSFTMYPFLGRWVDKQRLDYKRYMARKKSGGDAKNNKTANRPTGMTEERIRLLEAENFIWDPFNHMWEQSYNELCDFVALNGHSVIRERRGKYDPLARWATNQRNHYIKYLNGQKTTLTEERIEKLNRIGFSWDISAVKATLKSARSAAKRLTAKQHPKLNQK